MVEPATRMTTPAENEARIAESLMVLPTAIDRLQHLIDLSKGDVPLGEGGRGEASRVAGCQAQVWVVAEERGGCWGFRSDSDAPMVKAVARVLCQIYSGATAGEIAGFEPTLLETTGIAQNLTPTRREGARRIVEKIRGCAARAAST